MHEIEELYTSYRGLIYTLCNKYYMKSPRFSWDDLIGEAKVALLKANASFDAERQIATKSTYIYKAIDNELRKFVARNYYVINITEHAQRKQFKNEGKAKSNFIGIATSLDDDCFSERNSDVFASGSEPPDANLIRKESLRVLSEELQLLPDKERVVVEEYWLNKKTLEEIAVEFGVTKQTIHGWKNKGFEKLQKKVKSRFGE